ncbi:MAG TPA: hypothetical protein VM820_04075, partial [Vicinamibacterales bacterium]|nr:hypothetical protein [Vicinamibacterales bacterium]
AQLVEAKAGQFGPHGRDERFGVTLDDHQGLLSAVVEAAASARDPGPLPRASYDRFYMVPDSRVRAINGAAILPDRPILYRMVAARRTGAPDLRSRPRW